MSIHAALNNVLDHFADAHLNNAIILMAGLVVNVFGLPFLFVCHVSMFSKLLHKNIQGETTLILSDF